MTSNKMRFSFFASLALCAATMLATSCVFGAVSKMIEAQQIVVMGIVAITYLSAAYCGGMWFLCMLIEDDARRR